jgi:hypothetical protein
MAPVRDPHLVCASFLAGHWLSRGVDLELEELWLAPRGGVAEGVVRATKAESVHTLEYILISAEGERVVLRFNHFNRDFTTWEKDGPIELVLSSAGENELTFTNTRSPVRHAAEVGYRLTDPDAMTSWIVAVDENGAQTRLSFDYRKVS